MITKEMLNIVVEKQKNFYVVKGQAPWPIDNNKIHYKAACPPHRNGTFSGSGLPFANPRMAFEGTPNEGAVSIDNNTNFMIEITEPGSYYSALGTVLIPPTLYLRLFKDSQEHIVPVPICPPIPYRTNTYNNERINTMFYDNVHNLPVRSQEQVLRDSAYSINRYVQSFWNSKPSV